MQQPSSLVFVAIVVGWAVYLLPQWVYRREAFGQSHGTDRHSSGLRVLDRRRRSPVGPSSTPLLPDPRAIGDPVVDPLSAPSGGDGRVPPAPVPSATARPVGPSPAAAAAARRRLRVLTTLVLLTSTAWAVSMVVPAAVPAGYAVTALLGLDVAALVITGRRRAVRRAEAERAHRHRMDDARRAQRRPAPSGPAAAPGRELMPAAPAAPAALAAEPVAVREVVVAPVARPERASERVARELDAGTPSDTWTPVPVPPPTYTLKPAAPRHEPAPLVLPSGPPPTTTPTESAVATPAVDGEDAPRPSGRWDGDRSFADELDLDAVLARRRAVNG